MGEIWGAVYQLYFGFAGGGLGSAAGRPSVGMGASKTLDSVSEEYCRDCCRVEGVADCETRSRWVDGAFYKSSAFRL